MGKNMKLLYEKLVDRGEHTPEQIHTQHYSSLNSSILRSAEFQMLEENERNSVSSKNSDKPLGSVSIKSKVQNLPSASTSQSDGLPTISGVQNNELNRNYEVLNANADSEIICYTSGNNPQALRLRPVTNIDMIKLINTAIYTSYLSNSAKIHTNAFTHNSKSTNNLNNPVDLVSIELEIKDEPSTSALPPDCLPTVSNSENSELNGNTAIVPGAKIRAGCAIKKEIKKDNVRSKQTTQSKFYTDEPVDFRSLVPIIENITGTVNLKCNIDIKKVTLLRNTYYDPRVFSAVTMRIRNPKSTALIFNSGKIVCTGVNTIEGTRKACKVYARILQNLGHPVKFRNFRIQNMVVCYDLPFNIDMVKLRIENPQNKEKDKKRFDPQKFPAVKLTTGIDNICAKVFQSGKVVITGAKDVEKARQGFNNVYPIIELHGKQSPKVSA